MTSKRTLVKQKVTYGSAGDENSRDSDDDFSGKRTLTKRVSFESHELSESDSDAENSLGRVNRLSGIRRSEDSIDGLFRETSAKEKESSVELIKGTSEKSRGSKDKGEPKPAARPRPTISPRRSHFQAGHSESVDKSQHSSDEDDVASVTWPTRIKERQPVPPPRTSPRQHQERSSSPDMNSSRPVPRARPALSPRKGELKLFERDPDVDEYERTKNSERDDGTYKHEGRKNATERPLVPARKKKTFEESPEKDTERDHDRVFASEKTKNVAGEKPIAPSRRKKALEETHEKNVKKDNGTYEYERTSNLPEKPMAPSRRKKSLEETHEVRSRPQVPIIRTSTFEDDGPFQDNDRMAYEQDGNLRKPEKVKGRPVISVTRADSSEESEDEVDPGKVLYRKGSYGRQKYDDEDKVDSAKELDRRGWYGRQKYDSENKVDSEKGLYQKGPYGRQKYDDEDEVDSAKKLDRGGSSGRQKYDNEDKVDSGKGLSKKGSYGRQKYDDEDEVDSVKIGYRKGSYGRQNYDDDDDDDDAGDKLSHGRTVKDARQKSASTPPRPSPRSGAAVDHSMNRHSQLEEEVKHTKHPGSAPAMKKASSIETLSSQQGSLAKEGPSRAREHGAQKVQLKKSLTPQRPMSGKKGSLLAQLRQKATSDLVDTFEEHVPSTENVIETTSDDRKGNGRAWDASKSQRSGPLKANQRIETMTRSLHYGETPTDYWTDTKGTSHRGSVTPKRSSSMTNLRETSPEPWGGDSARSSQHSGFMDTTSIRQAVFDEWQKRKSVKLKEQAASKSAEKKKQEQKEQEERERKKLAKRAFESWNEMKQERKKEGYAKKKELMDKELEKQTEKNLKARDAKKYFESWKTKKDEELKQQHHKRKQEEREKKRKEEDEKQDKSKNAAKVFDNWKKNKDEKIKEEAKKKRVAEREGVMKQEDDKYERSIQSAERYQEWVEKKGKPRKGPPPPTLTQRSWCPSGSKSGNAIPERVGSVIQAPAPNRARTMSGSYYFKTNKY